MKRYFSEQKKYSTADFFNISPELVLNDFVIHILGRHCIIVENYKCIQGFSKECLLVKGKKQKMIIKGTHIVIRYFGDQELEITGNISNIEFSEL